MNTFTSACPRVLKIDSTLSSVSSTSFSLCGNAGHGSTSRIVLGVVIALLLRFVANLLQQFQVLAAIFRILFVHFNDCGLRIRNMFL